MVVVLTIGVEVESHEAQRLARLSRCAAEQWNVMICRCRWWRGLRFDGDDDDDGIVVDVKVGDADDDDFDENADDDDDMSQRVWQERGSPRDFSIIAVC